MSKTLIQRWGINALLIIVIIGLLIVVQRPRDESPSPSSHLSTLAKNQIQTLKIQYVDKHIEMQKQGERWFITQPLNIAADAERVDALLNLLDDTSINLYDSAGLDLTPYHLDTPRAILQLNEQPIEFGDTNPVTGQRYMLVNKQLTLSDDVYYPLLTSGLGNFIERTPIPSGAKVNRIALPEFSVFRNAQGQWKSDLEPSPNAEALAAFVKSWQQAKAFGVKPEAGKTKEGNIMVQFDGDVPPLSFDISETAP